MSGRRLSVRDYKRSRREGVSAAWLRPFALGLALGLLIAAAVFIETRHHFIGTGAAGFAAPAGAGAAEAAEAAEAAGAGAPAGAAAADTAAGKKAGTAAGVTAGAALPKYDFYQMLPRSQVLVPQRESEAHPPAEGPVDRAGTYFLQIGSYRDPAVAERVRAQVQKLGVSASVQRIVVDAATWHRVRVGPIHDLALLNRVRRELQAGNLEAMIVRVNP